MTQHTAGEWVMVEDAHFSEGTPITILAGPNNAIAAVVGHGDPLDESMGITDRTRANARLLVAAPELLAALRMFTDKYDTNPCTWPDDDAPSLQAAFAAIAKVEG